jgi:zinc protease
VIALVTGLLLAAAPPQPAALPARGLGVERAMLPGDLELVVLPIPGTKTASLRYVVRAGSKDDPAGRDGLAHVLEHVIVAGGGDGPTGLIDSARAAGATLNASTSREATIYQLDAPAEAFEPLAERYLRAVTNPSFPPAVVDRELKVVGREAELPRSSVVAFVEGILYRSQVPVGTTIGSAAGRDRVGRADLIEFFRRHYATSSTTIVLTGDVTVAGARALIERGMLLPPALPDEATTWNPEPPSLPVTEKLKAPVTVAVTGYLVDPSDREICRAAAEVIELRLVRDLELRKPLLSSVTAKCISLRGTDLLVAFGYSPTSDAEDLPTTLDEAFKGAGATPLTAAERRILEGRDGRSRDRWAGSPPSAANLLANSVARPRAAVATGVEGLAPLRFDPAGLRAFAKRTFAPARRLLVFVSPFEG